MKKSLIFFTFTIVWISAFTQTNGYHPFPDSNAVWREEYSYLIDPYCWHHNDYNLYTEGDTAIGNHTYHKLYTTGYVWESCFPPGIPSPPYYYYREYWGAFRQDSLYRQIYLYDNWNECDTLAYDFNLNVGDTLPVSYLNQFNYVWLIDSVLVGNQYNKRFRLSNGYDSSYAIIEGIGNTFGAFASLDFYFEAYAHLYCVKKNDQTVWTYDTSYQCELINRIGSINFHRQISVIPNPFSVSTSISVSEILKNADLTIYNALGQEVKKIKNISGGVIEIQRDNLPGGVYFIRLSQENNIITNQKVIITN